MTLRQDDALFGALAVSMGCLGLVYAITLRAVPKFWLAEQRTLTTWEHLTGAEGTLVQMLDGRPMHPPHRDPDHVEVFVCPYRRRDGTHAALLTERWRTEERPPRAGKMTRKGSVAEEAGLLVDGLELLEPFVAAHSTDGVLGLQETALGTLATKYYANVSYEVLSTGALNRLGVYAIEPAFDLKDTLEVATTFLGVAEHLAREGMHHSAPVSFRFGAASPALLSMHQGRRTVNLEVGLLRETPHAEEMFRTYEDVFVNGPLKARPHWGLDRNVLRGPGAVARLYPDTFEPWLRARDELDPRGLFDAPFTDRLGISRRST